mmetsp:Transcript_9980/g.16571  ORF Transcript_9980/g.16571 Transcript_9980/m.16571 type:complete len:258 (-) Transcript_9980:36-809(-)
MSVPAPSTNSSDAISILSSFSTFNFVSADVSRDDIAVSSIASISSIASVVDFVDKHSPLLLPLPLKLPVSLEFSLFMISGSSLSSVVSLDSSFIVLILSDEHLSSAASNSVFSFSSNVSSSLLKISSPPVRSNLHISSNGNFTSPPVLEHKPPNRRPIDCTTSAKPLATPPSSSTFFTSLLEVLGDFFLEDSLSDLGSCESALDSRICCSEIVFERKKYSNINCLSVISHIRCSVDCVVISLYTVTCFFELNPQQLA